jgi:hypothetical protein
VNSNLVVLLSTSAFLFFLSSCNTSSDSPKGDPKRDTTQELSELEKASCEFRADEGELAPSTRPATQLKTTHFQKVFDESLIQGVLAANAMETVRFAKFADLDFYSVNSMSQKSCKMLSFIASAGSTERNVFAELQNGRPKGSTILGIYFSPENKQFNGTNRSAFILVREDTTRWTLVHEYMHHLFSKEVQKVKRDIDLTTELDQELTAFEKIYEAYKKDESNQNLFLMTKSLEKMIGLRLELLRRYTLEEITIETYLSAQYNAGKFKYVPRIELAGAKSYISTNVKAAQEAETSLTKLINLSTQALSEIIKASPDLANEATLVDKTVQKDKSDLAALMVEVSALNRKNLYGLKEVVSSKASLEHQHGAGCSYSKEIEVQATAVIQAALEDIQQVLQ